MNFCSPWVSDPRRVESSTARRAGERIVNDPSGRMKRHVFEILLTTKKVTATSAEHSAGCSATLIGGFFASFFPSKLVALQFTIFTTYPIFLLSGCSRRVSPPRENLYSGRKGSGAHPLIPSSHSQFGFLQQDLS